MTAGRLTPAAAITHPAAPVTPAAAITYPGTPADLWPVLPPGFTTAALSVGAAAAHRVFGGIPGSKLPWLPARPLFMDQAHYRELARITGRLSRLVLEACQRRAGTAGELAGALDMAGTDLPLLDRAAPLGDDLLISLRPDAVYHDGVPKFLELNIDSAIGGSPHVDLVGGRFLHEYGQFLHGPARAGAGQEVALSVTAPSVQTRFAALADWLGHQGGHRMVIPVFPNDAVPGLGGDPAAFIAWLAPWCEAGRRRGIDTFAAPLEDLRLDAGGGLRAGTAPVDAVLRLFWLPAQPRSEGAAALTHAVLAGQVAMHTPEAACLLMNKRTLAWLWSDLDLLSEPDQRLVTTHIPYTVYLPAGTGPGNPLLRRARAGRAELVLKPGHGGGGTGVVVGPAVSPRDWTDALDHASAHGGYVLQEYVAPDTAPMDFVHRQTGDRRTADVPFVAGPFLFGGRPCGVLVRHGGPDGGAVLNAQHGAAFNAALLVNGPG